ncbi:MAG: radical SAM protein [Bdellovibrionales bacterium]|nr:radical SAM protein [Bdellovibrionales bacterium]
MGTTVDAMNPVEETLNQSATLESHLHPKISESFCVLPWIQRFINLGGEHQICCTSEEYGNSIRSSFGRILKVSNTTDPDKVQNASSLMRVRRQMLKGRWPAACARCKTVEKCGGRSRRQIENWRFSDRITEIIKSTNKRGRTTILPSYLDLRLGNFCNLVCRMCNPRASRKWSLEWNRVKLTWEKLIFIRWRYKYDWYRREKFKPFLKALLPHIRNFHVAGGEPLIIPETLELLKELQKTGISSSTEVSFNTNLTVLNQDLLKCLKTFKRVFFYVSVDAYGELNDYIRYPSKWTKIVDRVHEISMWAKDSPFVIQFNVTVQIYNILRLDELIDWIQSLDLPGVGNVPNLTILNNPSYYDIRNLPTNLKHEVTQTIEKRRVDWLSAAPSYARDGFAATLDSIIEHLKFPPSSRWTFSHFQSVTAALDASRKQNLESHLPEMVAPPRKGLHEPHQTPLGVPQNSAFKL